MKPWHLAAGILLILALPLLLLVGLLAGGVAASQQKACAVTGTAGTGGPAVLPVGNVGTLPTVAGYAGAQLVAAAAIMRAAADFGLGQDAQTLGVAAAMGESELKPITHGDAAGPDSLGYFQQRAGWGPAAARLDAYQSASFFFGGGQGGQPGLKSVAGWPSMTPSHAIHAVQRNADPEYYAPFYPRAQQVIAALGGGLPAAATPAVQGVAAAACPTLPGAPGGTTDAAAAVPAGPGGWARPAIGTLTSGFSPNRVNPVTHAVEPHNGQDIGNACGTPIYAAAAGTVIDSGRASGYGNWIRLDHGGGVITVYGHMKAADLLVHVGDKVTAGQLISRIGAEGQATGCHLHFQVEVNGVPKDPVPFMAARGVPLAATP